MKMQSAEQIRKINKQKIETHINTEVQCYNFTFLFQVYVTK